ncbi:MAG: CDP-alcohol phosphatidyltransferase family protein [Gammaproteobacteria bacterium]
MSIANALSALRLMLAPILLLLAWVDKPRVFLAVLVVAFLLDLVDGPIARRLQQVSAIGAELDSIADFAIYSVFIIGAWLLWPDIVRRESVYFAVVAASIAVPVCAGIVKFRHPTSLHTWMVKAAAVSMAPAAIALFAGIAVSPFRVATFVCVLAAVEECIIVAVLREPRSDVRSIFHVLRE